MKRSACLLLVGLIVSGCGILGPDGGLVLGTVFYNGSKTTEDIFLVPGMAVASLPITVSVYTDVGNCISGRDVTRVRVDGLTALIRPYDHDSGSENCTVAGLRPFLHEAEVVFEEIGDATLTLRARDFSSQEVIEVTRTIQVEGGIP